MASHYLQYPLPVNLLAWYRLLASAVRLPTKHCAFPGNELCSAKGKFQVFPIYALVVLGFNASAAMWEALRA